MKTGQNFKECLCWSYMGKYSGLRSQEGFNEKIRELQRDVKEGLVIFSNREKLVQPQDDKMASANALGQDQVWNVV